MNQEIRALEDPTSCAGLASASGPVEVTGSSLNFSFEEAIQDALAQAAAKSPAPPRNPDIAVSIEVKSISARSGGNIRPGLFVKAVVK